MRSGSSSNPRSNIPYGTNAPYQPQQPYYGGNQPYSDYSGQKMGGYDNRSHSPYHQKQYNPNYGYKKGYSQGNYYS